MKSIYKFPAKILFCAGKSIVFVGICFFVFGHLLINFSKDK